MENILNTQPIDSHLLNERVTKAKQFFATALHDELIVPINNIQAFLKGKTKIKQYIHAVNELEAIIWKKLNDVQRITFGDLSFDIPQIEKKIEEAVSVKSQKPVKGSTKTETLEFYKQGMNVEAIAKQRGLTVATIEGHLADFIATGEVNIFDLISQEALETIIAAVEKSGSTQLTPIKQIVGETISYAQIRIALNYLKVKETQASER